MSFSIFHERSSPFFDLPYRPADSHKGTFGKVLLVCGSPEMSGAAYFAAKACYRMGAGLCRILTARENLPVLATLLPEALLTGYDAKEPEADILEDALAWADVLVMGCGLGTSSASRSVLSQLLRARKIPCVLDADALNLLARNPTLFKYAKGAILTPHAMEMSRLCGKDLSEITADPEDVAYRFAKKHGVVCVLKGHRTAVSDGGELLYRNETGNSGMATGGSGDVLAGIIGGLLAGSLKEGPDAFRCACLGVRLHGQCGDHAAERLTEYSVMASDLIDSLPFVLKDTMDAVAFEKALQNL